MRFGTKWLDLEAQALRDDEGNEHPLTASEFGLLKVFAANPKRVLSRERLLELANARDAEAFDRAVDLRIMRIRRKIEIDPTKPAVIRTIRGGGYLFSPDRRQGVSCRILASAAREQALIRCGDRRRFGTRRPRRSQREAGRHRCAGFSFARRLRERNFRPHPAYFRAIEITGIFVPNVSSLAARRNNSPAHETIFPLACRRPETVR